MKKISAVIAIMVIAIAITFAIPCGVAFAEETNAVYTYSDEEGTVTIEILNETECNLTLITSEKTTSKVLLYSIKDDILTITNPEIDLTIQFKICEGNILEEFKKVDKEVDVEVEVIDDDTLKAKVSEVATQVFGKYLDEDKISMIVTLACYVIEIIMMICIWIKYRKFKHTSFDDFNKILETNMAKSLKDNFGDLGTDIGSIVANLAQEMKKIEEQQNALLQAFALSQDKSAEGKLAMLQLIQGKTEDEVFEEQIEEIKQEIIETEAAVEEKKEPIQGEYKEIF